MKYLVSATDGQNTSVQQLDAKNPTEAVNKAGYEGSEWDYITVYQLARVEQPVAKFEAVQAIKWEEV